MSSVSTRSLVKERSRCPVCGEMYNRRWTKLTKDHVFPKACGGSIVTRMCSECNHLKSASYPTAGLYRVMMAARTLEKSNSRYWSRPIKETFPADARVAASILTLGYNYGEIVIDIDDLTRITCKPFLDNDGECARKLEDIGRRLLSILDQQI